MIQDMNIRIYSICKYTCDRGPDTSDRMRLSPCSRHWTCQCGTLDCPVSRLCLMGCACFPHRSLSHPMDCENEIRKQTCDNNTHRQYIKNIWSPELNADAACDNTIFHNEWSYCPLAINHQVCEAPTSDQGNANDILVEVASEDLRKKTRKKKTRKNKKNLPSRWGRIAKPTKHLKTIGDFPSKFPCKFEMEITLLC